MSSHHVFVYGTLKRGFPNHATLAEQPGAAFIAMARTVERFPLVVQGQWFSPAMLPEPGEGERVTGELWRVDEAGLAALDRLESTHLPTGYDRAEIAIVRAGKAESEVAWVYFKRRARIAVIHSAPLADYQDRRYVPAWLRPRS